MFRPAAYAFALRRRATPQPISELRPQAASAIVPGSGFGTIVSSSRLLKPPVETLWSRDEYSPSPGSQKTELATKVQRARGAAPAGLVIDAAPAYVHVRFGIDESSLGRRA